MVSEGRMQTKQGERFTASVHGQEGSTTHGERIRILLWIERFRPTGAVARSCLRNCLSPQGIERLLEHPEESLRMGTTNRR